MRGILILLFSCSSRQRNILFTCLLLISLSNLTRLQVEWKIQLKLYLVHTRKGRFPCPTIAGSGNHLCMKYPELIEPLFFGDVTFGRGIVFQRVPLFQAPALPGHAFSIQSLLLPYLLRRAPVLFVLFASPPVACCPAFCLLFKNRGWFALASQSSKFPLSISLHCSLRLQPPRNAF